jgi:hypothetical protein
MESMSILAGMTVDSNKVGVTSPAGGVGDFAEQPELKSRVKPAARKNLNLYDIFSSYAVASCVGCNNDCRR